MMSTGCSHPCVVAGEILHAVRRRHGKQIQKKERITHLQWRERAGQRCLPIYIWNYPDSFDAEHTIEIILVFDTDGQASIRSYAISYYPFRFEQLSECLKSVGFVESHSDFDKNTSGYRVIAS
jgi:hypothetical protein